MKIFLLSFLWSWNNVYKKLAWLFVEKGCGGLGGFRFQMEDSGIEGVRFVG